LRFEHRQGREVGTPGRKQGHKRQTSSCRGCGKAGAHGSQLAAAPAQLCACSASFSSMADL
jgi:hypothetical protein